MSAGRERLTFNLPAFISDQTFRTPRRVTALARPSARTSACTAQIYALDPRRRSRNRELDLGHSQGIALSLIVDTSLHRQHNFRSSSALARSCIHRGEPVSGAGEERVGCTD